MRRDRISWILLALAAGICALPLMVQGPSCGHDFDFHVLNWMEAAAQFRHGNLHPQWAVSAAWNAGEPRFVFYPPLSWTLGALMGLVMGPSPGGWTLVPIAYTWAALTASGLSMYRLARAHAGPQAALIAGTVYLANPYMLFTAYERTAYAELLAAAFLPLLMHAVLERSPTIPGIAVPLGLLWVTNAPAAVMGTYMLALLAMMRVMRGTTLLAESLPALRLAWRIGAGTMLGFALAAFYIYPAASERPLVQIAMVVIPGMRVDDNTLFHRTGVSEDALAHDAVLHTASLIAVILLCATGLFATLAALLPAKGRARGGNGAGRGVSRLRGGAAGERPAILVVLGVVTGAIAMMLTRVSLPVWHHAPELAFLQFPWRLLAVMAVAFGMAAALALDAVFTAHRERERAAMFVHPARRPGILIAGITSLSIVSVLTAAAYNGFRQPCDAMDTVRARLSAFQNDEGSEPTDEYTPVPADNDSLGRGDPPFWLAANPDDPPPPQSTPGPVPLDLNLTAPAAEYLILNLRQFPAWHLSLNGHDVPSATLTRSLRADGLLNLPVPAGANHLVLTYRFSPLERGAQALSGGAMLLTAVVVLRRRRGHPRLDQAS